MLNESAVGRRTIQQWNQVDEATATREVLKCAYSFQYFVDQFAYIRDKVTKRVIPFDLWDAQRDAADLFETENRLVVLKARQLGLSWLAQAYAVYSMLFDPIQEILIFSKTEDEAIDFLERMRGIYELLPEWMKSETVVVDQKKKWELSNGSRANALAGTRGDSYAATMVIFDEADHTTKDFAEMYERAEPTVGDSGKIFVISTSNKDKPNSFFKSMFSRAYEGLTDYVALFIPWYARPDRSKAWHAKTKKNYHNLYGSYDEFYGSYPETPAEALGARTLNKYFPPEWIMRVYDDSPPLYWVGRDGYDDPPDAVPNHSGLIIYEMPRAGKKYMLGVDTAEGLETSDDSVVHVFEIPYMVEVAHYSAQLDPVQLGRLVNDVALFYNNAIALVERNNHGHATIGALENIGQIQLAVGLDGRIGWQTNVASKAVMFDWSFDIFRSMACVVRTMKTVTQLQSIERSLKAPQGSNDDCAISFVLGIACYVNREMTIGFGGLVQP